MQATKLDTSLSERQGILELLERLKADGITLGELEEIGLRMRQAGLKALRPLLRELWREKKGELISKYAYVLDFFDEEAWLDQLIQIVLKRRDLGEDAKAALQVALRGYGIDLHAPPFREIFFGGSSALECTPGGGGPGSEGLAAYLEDFLSHPSEIQQLVLRELPKGGGYQVIRMLEALLWHHEESVVEGALAALGTMRETGAASALARYLEEGDPKHRSRCRQSLRRLSFVGVAPEPVASPLPFHSAYASVPDGDGYRALLLSRWVSQDRICALYLQVHERRGLLAAWGGEELTPQEFATEFDSFCAGEDLYAVDAGYVVELVRDALYWSGDLAYLPADFYLQRSVFRGELLTPKRYLPDFGEHQSRRTLSYLEGESVSAQLLADPFFSGWFMAEQRVYDFAEEHGSGGPDQVLQRFCAELVTPQLDRIRDRLLMSADLMRRCGRETGSVADVVALAQSLESYRLPHHLHPFLRSFALESLQAVRSVSLDM